MTHLQAPPSLFFHLSLLALCASLSACDVPLSELSKVATACARDDGPRSTKTRKLASFSKLEVHGNIDVVVTRGEPQPAKLTAPQERLAEIETVVENDKLIVRREGTICGDTSAKLEVWTPSLSDVAAHGATSVSIAKFEVARPSLTATGSSSIEADDLVAERVSVKTGGASEVALSGQFEQTTVEASGSSNVSLKGRSTTLRASLSGSSDLNAESLSVDEGTLHASGSSDARVDVREKLIAHAGGASDIRYTGNPKQVLPHTTGSADIHRF